MSRSTRHHPNTKPENIPLEQAQAEAVEALEARQLGTPTHHTTRPPEETFAAMSHSPRIGKICPKCGLEFEGSRAAITHARDCDGDPNAQQSGPAPVTKPVVIDERANLARVLMLVAGRMGQASERAREKIRLNRQPVEIQAVTALNMALVADLDPNDATAIRNAATQQHRSLIEWLYGSSGPVESILDRWEAAGRPTPKLPPVPVVVPISPAPKAKAMFGRQPKGDHPPRAA